MTSGSANDGKQPGPSASPASPAPAEPPIDFERAVEQVEAIIERIESGEIGLEKSISEYERGAALIKRCRLVLQRAEQRVEELTAQMHADAAGSAPPSPSTPAATRSLPTPRLNDTDDDPESPF